VGEAEWAFQEVADHKHQVDRGRVTLRGGGRVHCIGRDRGAAISGACKLGPVWLEKCCRMWSTWRWQEASQAFSVWGVTGESDGSKNSDGQIRSRGGW
jgi:hypothetical protein